MSTNFIYNETMSGTVDGINKVFTTAFNIENIEEVYIGGAPYRSISFTSGTNVVTLTDAPTVALGTPTIDYFVESLSTTPTGDVTFGEIIQDTYDNIGVDRTSRVIVEAKVKKYINEGIRKIKNLRYFRDKVQSYSFNKSADSNAIGYDASTITVTESSYIPADGMIILGAASMVSYSSYTAGVLTSNAGYVYTSGDNVNYGYKIPAGVKRPSEVIMDGETLIYVDPREFKSDSRIDYTIFTASNGDEFIFLPRTESEKVVAVRYIPDYNLFVNDSDIVPIEYEYGDVLSLYATYNTLRNREDDRWQGMKQEYLEQMRAYRAYKSREVDGINNRIRSSVLKGI